MANTWFRVYAEFATDPKVQMMSESDQRRLLMLMCLRCNGDVTLQDSEVAFQLRITVDEYSMSKLMFIDKGFIDTSNNIINWDKRQFISDSSTSRVAKHREKMKRYSNTCNTSSDTDTDTDTEYKKEIVKEKKPSTSTSVSTPTSIIRFVKPTLQEITDFCILKNYSIDPETFLAHYESNGWVVGQAKAKMKCWKSALVTWGKRNQNRANNNANNNGNNRFNGSKGEFISGVLDKNLNTSVANAMGGCDLQADAGNIPFEVDFTVPYGERH